MKGIEINELVVQKEATTIINQLSAQFSAGSFVLLTCDSGCGKTTLLHTVAGFDGSTYQGEILVNGQNNAQRTMTEKAQQIGLMFQNPSQQFTMRTLRRELMFAMENSGIAIAEAKERMDKAIHEMKMESLLHQELATLSGGEKQRAALTVLLAMNAPILLLDEPFASVDPLSRKWLIKKLADLRNQGKLILIADHELTDYAPFVDRFIRMEGGQLTEQSVSQLAMQQPLGKLTQANASQTTLFTLQQVALHQGTKPLVTPQTVAFKQGITTLTGENGVGKSTLLRAMVQLHPYTGAMFLEDKKLSRRFGKKKLYEQMTLAVQQAEQQFVTLHVDQELAFPKEPSEAIKQRQLQAMEELGIQHLLNRGLYQLSEGQKKMIQLITMLSLERKFLLLDEPFTGLDARACQYFVDWLVQKKEQTNVLIVSHRLEPLVGVSEHHMHLSEQKLQEVVH